MTKPPRIGGGFVVVLQLLHFLRQRVLRVELGVILRVLIEVAQVCELLEERCEHPSLPHVQHCCVHSQVPGECLEDACENHSGDEDAAHHDPVGRVERVLQEDRPELPDHRGDEDENGWEDDPGQRDKQHEPYGHRVPREVALLRPVVQLLPELVLVHRLGDVWRHASCLAWAEAGIDLVAVARISGDVATLTEGKTWRVVVCHTYSVTQVYRDEMLTS